MKPDEQSKVLECAVGLDTGETHEGTGGGQERFKQITQVSV